MNFSMSALIGRIRSALSIAPRQRITIYEEMAVRYFDSLNGLGLDPKTLSNKRCAQNYLTPAFAGRPVSSIRPWEIARLTKVVHDDGLYVTSRQILSEARAMFNVALMEGWVDTNPALHVKRLPAPVRRRRLRLEQFFDIHRYGTENLPPWFPAAMRLALVTAQRRSDLVHLRQSDIRDGHLFVEQYKTGARVAIPLALRLNALDCTVGDVIHECMQYGPHDTDLLLRTKARPARQLAAATITNRFWTARKAACPHDGPGTPPTFHEIRSLSERLYREQGINTQILLGHTTQQMTDLYNNDRGLSAHEWKYVPVN